MNTEANNVVVVTGGARGIGRAIAERLLTDGLSVALWDLDEKAALGAAEELAPLGPALGVGCNVSDRASVAAAAEATSGRLGVPWALVSNAGVDRFGLFAESDAADWKPILDVNLLGALHATKALLDPMLERRDGRIVFVSSDAARVGSTGEAVYAAAKAGLLGFAKSLARETARRGVRVNAVCPGPTDTALLADVRSSPRGDKIMDAVARSIPLGRIGTPADIAGVVSFLLSADASYMTGQILSVSGGLTMV